MGTVAALRAPPTLDGDVAGDPAWQGLAAFTDFKQLQPDNGAPATQRTEAYFGHTEKALYVGVICHEADPSKIVVSNDGFASDSFAFVLDTFRSGQTALVFGTNPVGAEYDGQVAASTNFADWNWSTVWTVRARTHERGWSAEFEIPFSSLRYPAPRAGGEGQRWGVNIARVIQRNSEIAYWSPVPKQLSMYRLDLAGTVGGVRPPKQPRHLQFTPYALGSVVRTPGADDAREHDVGFDLKYSLTSSLTLDVTYNTDFAQVESDAQQVNFGRFSLFFPETRPFFLENAGAFEAGSRDVLLFHSRRIGIAAGQRLAIDGGVRVSGRLRQRNNIGLLHMRTAAAPGTTDKIDYTVLRARRDLPNRSSVGLLATNRSAEDDRQTYAADGRLGIGLYGLLRGFLARTTAPSGGSENHAFSLFGSYNSPTWAYDAGFTEVGAHFDPAVGFVGRRDFRKFDVFVQHTVQMEGRRGLSEWKPFATYTGHWDFDGYHESGSAHVESWFAWRSGADVWTAFTHSHEGVKAAFPVAGAIVPPGEYDNPGLNLGVNSPAGRPWRFGLISNIGGYYNGDRVSASPSVSYRKGESLTATLSWDYNRIDLPSAESAFDVNLVQGHLAYSFTPKIGLQALLQYNDASHVLAANLRFSWLRSASSGLYVVYNEVDDRSALPLRSRREFTLKYSHIFNVL